MPINDDTYKQKALEAVREVFVKEYKNSIGIPLPEIGFVFPDSTDYKTGQYYITIDDTWQIHLNFGLLPVSYKDFQEEVKVLTRHEVEHYMCCPFDILTHFRMLKTIIDTYNKHYTRHNLNIVAMAGSLANQVADIIVDTKNFKRYKIETLKSEISWIKNAADITKAPRHSKLMFLTKETLWKENLELNETDEELLNEVKALSQKIEESGIENKELFLKKVEAYTHLFFNLFEQDQKEVQQKQKNSEQSQSECGQPQIIPSRDSQENGSQFVFQAPDKIQEALEQLSQETSIQQFNQILSAAGFNSFSEKDKRRIWFEAQSINMIPIEEAAPIGSNDNYSYPTSWKLGDPIEDIDMMLTFVTSPIFIPGVTTKKWEQNAVFNFEKEKKQRDLLLVIDTSGSMGNVTDSKSNMHQAILVSYGIIKFFESTKSQVALIGFSDRINVCIEWTKEYDEVREKLIMSGNGGSSFPIRTIQDIIEKTKNKIVTVIITDGEISNIGKTIDYFRNYLNEGNKLFIFLQNKKSQINQQYQTLIDYGAKIVIALTAKEMCEVVVREIQ
jgi:Mg-chelatase subunit ChlD